jgi:hypothetical protein
MDKSKYTPYNNFEEETLDEPHRSFPLKGK